MHSPDEHTPYAQTLTRYLRHSFKVLEHQQADMVATVSRLEPYTRTHLVNSYGEQSAWRGLASDDFLIAWDMMQGFERAVFPTLDHSLATHTGQQGEHL